MAQQSIEERLAFLESKIAEYEAERAQMRSLERVLRSGQSELRDIFQAHQEYVTNRLHNFETHITARLDVAEDNNAARFAELQTGQLELRQGQQEHKIAIEKLQIGQLELRQGQQEHKIAIEKLQIGQLEHKVAIENLADEVRGLAAGQQQILDLLTGGKPKKND